MNGEIPEPENISLTSREFLDELRGRYKKEVAREHNRTIFGENPQKYRKMGLNEYLEKDNETQEEIVIPKMNGNELASLAQEANVSIKVDKLNRDPGIIVLLVEGTLTAIKSFKIRMEQIHNKLPGDIYVDGEAKVLDIPSGREDLVIGKNGVNVYKLQKDFKVIARVIDGVNSGLKALLISGNDKDRVQEACNYVIDLIYRDFN
ncbi:KH domain-containing protein [Encephalitozoon intestinalis]